MSEKTEPNWAELRALAKPRLRFVDICLDGNAVAALTDYLENVLGGSDEQRKELEDAVRASTVTFKLKGLDRGTFRLLEKENQEEIRDEEGKVTGQKWSDAFPEALVRACLVYPEVSEEEPFSEVLTQGEFDRLFEAAFTICNEVSAVPLVTRD